MSSSNPARVGSQPGSSTRACPGFEVWLADASSAGLATRIRETLDQLRAVSVGDPS